MLRLPAASAKIAAHPARIIAFRRHMRFLRCSARLLDALDLARSVATSGAAVTLQIRKVSNVRTAVLEPGRAAPWP
jgi:hypothetical protein